MGEEEKIEENGGGGRWYAGMHLVGEGPGRGKEHLQPIIK